MCAKCLQKSDLQVSGGWQQQCRPAVEKNILRLHYSLSLSSDSYSYEEYDTTINDKCLMCVREVLSFLLNLSALYREG